MYNPCLGLNAVRIGFDTPKRFCWLSSLDCTCRNSDVLKPTISVNFGIFGKICPILSYVSVSGISGTSEDDMGFKTHVWLDNDS